MSSSHLISRTLKSLYMLCSMLAFCSMPLFAQTAESDPATSLPTTEAAGSSGRETQPHETGSVEASAPAMKDRIFLRQAVTHGMLQVKLSELAQQKAGGADVKEYAARLIADHARVEEGLRAAAESQGVMLPTKLQSREQTIYERFQKLSGEEFDREYIRTTLEDHRRDLREFHSEAAGTPDQSLRTTVQDGARLLHQQLAAADQLARSRGSQNARPAKVADSIPPR